MVLFKKIACKGKYQDDQAISDVVTYITRPDKTPTGLVYGVNVDLQNIAESMIAVSKQYGKYTRLRLHHFIITFKPENKGNFTLFSKLMEEICSYIGRVYQIVAALHEDTQHPHIHFVFNAVSYVNGYKFHGGKEDYYELIEMIASILSAHKIYPLIPVKYIPKVNNPHE